MRNEAEVARTWGELRERRQAGPGSIGALFEADAGRAAALSREACGLLLDFSRTALEAPTLDLLIDLARHADVPGRRDAMFEGAVVNPTEGRAALHVALRAPEGRAFSTQGADVTDGIRSTRQAVFAFARDIRSGAVHSSTDAAFTDVVNIGIGGSDLGPAMAAIALKPYHSGPRTHFVSNVDGAHLKDTLGGLDPASTLFVVSSKTFTTAETMLNARSARRWIEERLGADAVPHHFAAVSTNLKEVDAFGIRADRTFGFWDWVGGRYSIWSSIGLALVLAIGPERYAEFLAGAAEMDEHFRTEDPARNLPILLGLIGVWHRSVCGYGSRALLPYEQRLARFPAYVQQLDMESNGKAVRVDGSPVEQPTGPVVWGEPGTNGQHAFHQLLHQGTDVIPCEFLIGAEGHEPEYAEHHRVLIANCLAQAQALTWGRSAEEVRSLLKPGADPSVVPHRVFLGDRPSVTIAYPQLTPATLGKLIALYEHRVFVEAAIWDINPFDQWGVELGKELAQSFLPLLRGEDSGAADAATGRLAQWLGRHRGSAG
jgi:glucose-6-phosphate isomerase